jgi:hypothetical protein
MHMREDALGGAAAFGLNWVWENAQAPLYKGYAGFAQDVQMCTVATLGDVAIVAVIWATVALSWRDSTWHRHPSFARYGAAVVGVCMAVAIEYWALATDRWTYAGMPLVPYTQIGLLPLVQMLLIPPLVFALMLLRGRAGRSAAETDAIEDR